MPVRNPQMGRILKQLADHFIILDAEDLTRHAEYSDADCMNALIVFNHITANRLVHKMSQLGVDLEGGCDIAEAASRDLRALFKGFTGIDPHKYHHK